MRDAKVISTDDDNGNPVWGVELYQDGVLLTTEWFPMHNKFYAEDAAENFINGIKEAPSEIQLNLFDTASVKEKVGG